MTNHYDTLNLHSDATQDEIKAAYRRAAQAAHPDKGGSQEQMQAINRAYEVLSDPERRAQYDVTGEDRQPDENQKAVMELMKILQDAVNRGAHDPIKHANLALDNGRKEIAVRIELVKRNLDSVRKLQGKVRAKEGENLFESLLQAKLDEGAKTLSQLDDLMLHLGRVQVLVNNFEFTGDPEQDPDLMRNWTKAFTA